MAEIDRDTLPTVAEGRALAGDATGGATGAPAEAVEIDPEMPLAGSREALTPLDEQGLRSSRPPRLPAAWPATSQNVSGRSYQSGHRPHQLVRQAWKYFQSTLICSRMPPPTRSGSTISNRRRASAAGNASYSDAGLWVLRLS